MQLCTKATASFDASHTIPLPVRCQKMHGHHFVVVAVNRGPYEPRLQEALESLLYELDGRDANQMIVGGASTVTGMAGWLLERLLSTLPNVVSVEVSDSKGLTGMAERELR